MTGTVMSRGHERDKDKPAQLVCTDRNGCRIGNIELPGVDGDNQTPQNQLDKANPIAVENNDLKIAPNHKIEEEAAPIEPNPIEPHYQVETVQEEEYVQEEPAQTTADTVPVKPEPIIAPVETTGAPVEITGVRRSTRVRFPTTPGYTPSITGSSH